MFLPSSGPNTLIKLIRDSSFKCETHDKCSMYKTLAGLQKENYFTLCNTNDSYVSCEITVNGHVKIISF